MKKKKKCISCAVLLEIGGIKTDYFDFDKRSEIANFTSGNREVNKDDER